MSDHFFLKKTNEGNFYRCSVEAATHVAFLPETYDNLQRNLMRKIERIAEYCDIYNMMDNLHISDITAKREVLLKMLDMERAKLEDAIQERDQAKAMLEEVN